MSLCQPSLELCLVWYSGFLYSFLAPSELMTLISSSLSPYSRAELLTGWMCRPDVLGLPASLPSRSASSFCRLLSRSSWRRKKTTPRWETIRL